MRIAVLREEPSAEPRVAATPETVRKFAAAGASVTVESGAGTASGFSDAKFRDAGAELAETAGAALADADLVLTVRRPDRLDGMKRGAALVALMDPYGNEAALHRMAEAGLSALSLELIPRITRAQVMDVLSSQANLAGYQAVIEAAAAFGRAMPMMMTAAGTVPAARVFVMGAGGRGTAGDRHGAAAWRGCLRDGRAAGRQGAGRLTGRQIHRRRGRRVQGGGNRRRLRQGNVGEL
jgi:NAD(P) transhydrogenase subunit alpha